MTTKPMSIKPGLLIALRTTIAGGVEYRRVDLDAGTTALADDARGAVVDATDATPVDVTRWETTKIVTDVAQYDRAKKVRSKASSLIRGACAQSAFGLVCPVSKEAALDAAYAEALALVEAHNAQSDSTRVSVYMLKGRIAETDEAATRAIASEVRELLDGMKTSIASADVGAIREAANKARQLGQMLDDDTKTKVGRAIEEARSAAKAIVKRIETGGEDAALVLQELSRKSIDEARFAFLDLEPAAPVTATAAHAAPVVDLEPAAEVAETAKPVGRQLDLDGDGKDAAAGVQ